MNRFNPQKLLDSKWTAVSPSGKEKHFVVTGIELDDTGGVASCTIEAILSRRPRAIDWRALRDAGRWTQGWK